jgi:predicted TIM-barrel fold metal-dependent hydrolase
MIRESESDGNHRSAPDTGLAAALAYVVLLVTAPALSCRSEPARQSPSARAPAAIGGSVTAPRIPKIDVHMHVDPQSVQTALDIMRAEDIRVGLNASGGYPEHGLQQSMELAERTGGRLLPLCNVRLSLAAEPGFEAYARTTAQQCKALGGRGIKIPKSLGLGVVNAEGRLLPVDAPVFDALFDEAGKQGLPVLLHSADPKAFFRAPTPDNERYEELHAHPGWSFHGIAPNGEPWPTWQALLDQFERRVARHPQTTFVGAHFGNAAEEPERVARMLDAHPNLVIDTAARVPEFGRQSAATMRALFLRHQDRILFGSDLGVFPEGLALGSTGELPDRREDAPRFFQAHYRYFETDEPNLATPTPIQGRWALNGIGLPRPVLEKLYWRNAARVFSLSLPSEPAGSTQH